MLHQPIAAEAETPAAAATATRGWTTRRFLLAVLGIWLLAATIICGVGARAIAGRAYPDVDDQLRIVEVRDWLAGQSFWDVSQHRMNQPFGAPMHWSRIVDAPLAAVELALRPLTGAPAAELAAAVIVPMLTLCAVMLLVALIGRRLSGPRTGLLAAALAPTAVAMMMQMQPLRVDHHGWEIACAMAALAALLVERPRWAGALAGAAIAIGLQISLELLPFAAALGGIVAARWAIAPDGPAARRLAGYAGALLVVEAALFAALHPRSDWIAYCDAVSPPHLLALAVAGIGVPAWVAVRPRTVAARGCGLALVALAAAAAFRAVPPHCGLDPFSALGPIERRLWLANVLEGRPVWHAGPDLALALAGFPIVGLACTAWIIRGAEGAARARWIEYGAALLAATAVGIAVLRACALANAVALVPVAHVAIGIVARLLDHRRAAVRVGGSAAVLTLLSPWAPGLLGAMLPLPHDPGKTTYRGPHACGSFAAFRALDRLAPARFLAPLDIGPPLLLDTHHAVLASGHHRNHVAMADELYAMTGTDEAAERILRRHGIGYVLICPDLNEMAIYRRAAPSDFAAHLLDDRAPPWLGRVRLPGSRLLVWRVRPPQPPAGLPSSRSAGGSVPAPAQISRSAAFSPSS